MKHFKKKFQFQFKLDDEKALNEFKIKLNTPNDKKTDKPTLDFMKSNQLKARLSYDKFYIDAFAQKIDKNLLLMPLPDLTLVYLEHTYFLYSNYKKLAVKEKLIKDLNTLTNEEIFTESIVNSIYLYIGYKTSIITLLCASIESFFNQFINDRFDEKIVLKQRDYIIDYKLNFNEKIKLIIPFITEKNYNLSNNIILNLNKLRDKIIHLKYGKKGMVNSELIDELLNFSFEKTYNEVVNYYNFHKPNYIEECNCGIDY